MGFWRFFLLLSFWLDTSEEAQAEAAEAVGFPCISEALFLNYLLLSSYEAAPTEPAEEHAQEVCVSALHKPYLLLSCSSIGRSGPCSGPSCDQHRALIAFLLCAEDDVFEEEEPLEEVFGTSFEFS